MAGVGYIDYYIPQCKMSIKEFIYQCDSITKNKENIDSIIKELEIENGLKAVSMEEDFNILHRLKDMVQKYLDETKVDPENIRYILFTDLYNFQTEDGIYVPYYIQKEFQFNQSTVLLIGQQCASSLWSIGSIASMLAGKEVALILSTCKVKHLQKRYMGFTVVGDGAGIIEMKAKDYSYEICDYNFKSCSFDENDIVRSRISIVKKGVEVIQQLTSKNGLRWDDIELFVPQNLNKKVYTSLYARLLRFPKEKMFLDNIGVGGHVGDVDVIVNLKDVIDSKKIHVGNKMILYGIGSFGNNYNYNCILIRRIR